MKNIDIVKDAISNTGRSKVRTGLTVTAIFIGAFTLTLTDSVGAGISSYIDNQIGSLGNQNVISVHKTIEEVKSEGPVKYEKKSPGSSSSDRAQQGASQMGMSIDLMTDEDIEKIESFKNVESVDPTIMANPDYIEGQNGEQFVFSPNPAAGMMIPDLKAGKGFTEKTVNYEIILPPTYVEALGYSSDEEIIDQTVTIGVTDYAFKQHKVEAHIVGVQNKSLFGESVSMSQGLTEELAEIQKAGLPKADASYLSALINITPNLDKESVEALKAELLDNGYEGQTVDDQLGVIQSVISGLIGVLNAFAVITLIAASFGIMNTLLMSVKERTREIGLMKAMGMSSSKIFGLFSLEAVIIGFLGSALGAAAAILTGTAASNYLGGTLLADLEGLTISLFTAPDVATVILIVMGIAFLSGTIPAAGAAKQNPIDALHYE
jgi:putative ABC transport system permease protein